MLNRSIEHSRISPRQIKAMPPFRYNPEKEMSVDSVISGLTKMGINLRDSDIRDMMSAMDSLQPSVTTPSVTTPLQFLQTWLPGFTYVLTGARKIDELIGIATIGSFEDEQVVQGVLERLGTSLPYGDYTQVPFGTWNTNFEIRTNVRFEEGLQVGFLEQRQAARMNLDVASTKRNGAALSLDIERNNIGFFGYNNGNNHTYGFLNDPSLPAYVTVANGASGSPLWSNKTMLEIVKDIQGGYVALRNQSQDVIDPANTEVTIAVATNSVDWLTTITEFGISTRDWIKENYPKTRIESAPQLNNANGGANVFYMYAETVNDGSTDDNRVFSQNVAARFQTIGVQQMAKIYIEDYANATAGVMCKRPYAVVRRSGI